MRIAWITDPHFNHVPAHRWDAWASDVRARHADAILITGDISEGEDVVFELRRMVDAFDVPIHFVLGNHDFYSGSVGSVRREIVDLARQTDQLTYLTDCQPLGLADGTFLIGEDGWGDATVGDAARTPVRLHDFEQIEDLRGLSVTRRNARLQILGRECADRLKAKLQSLPTSVGHVIVAMHIPPFRNACWYQGDIAGDDWAPFFINGQAGDALLAFAEANPRVKTTVLCGHTHHAGIAKMLPNLIVYTGKAQYAYPEIQGMVEIAGDVLVRLNP